MGMGFWRISKRFGRSDRFPALGAEANNFHVKTGSKVATHAIRLIWEILQIGSCRFPVQTQFIGATFEAPPQCACCLPG